KLLSSGLTPSFPASANVAQQRSSSASSNNNYNRNNRNQNRNNHSHANSDVVWPSPPSAPRPHQNVGRPYLGRCQICSVQGHSARRCPQLAAMTSQSSPQPHPPLTPWQSQPRANLAVGSPYIASNWLLDSGATHHITSQQSLAASTVKDLSTGALLLQGRTKDELYEWLVSSPQAMAMLTSSTKSTYSWLYPLKHKSQVKETFIAFKALVENHFKSRIDTLYSDNGGEFIALRSFLATHGISHLTTPPHTPEHNGLSERKHRHVVETGLTLMTEASLLKHYWPYAFAAAVYLINRLPTPVLNNDSPYHRLFGTLPNYGKLRVFGCLCFPWLRPYTAHKLDARSKPCVFVGYSLTQSGYLCLDPETERVYVSRHVQFDELTFPFCTSASSMEAPPVVDTSVTTSLSVIRLPSPEQVPPCSVPHPPPPPPTNVSLLSPSQVLPSNPQTPSTAPHEPQNQILPPLNPSPPVPNPEMANSQTPSTEVSPMPSSRPSSPLPQPSPPLSPQPPPPPPPPAPLPEIVPQPEPDNPDEPMNTHQMRTRSKNNITKPSKKLSLLAALKNLLPMEPTTITQALKDPNWGRAVSDEFGAHIRNHSWDLVPPNPSQNVVGCRWVFTLKYFSTGLLDRHKARLVAKGFLQQYGVDY
ncbi:unnamed protein product, partial [Microthlaspi erraticum]